MIVTRTFLGTPPFPVAAKAALANSQLRSNMRNATHTIRDKRARVIGELDDFEQLRDAAADIKDDVLANMARYLVQAEEALTRAGATVHWARDAAEANRIVVGIAASHKVDEVVKVKSMATDTSGFFIENVPPNPQHSSASGRSTIVIPRTAPRSRSQRLPTPSNRVEWQEGCRVTR